jgi:hypothetical protein
MAGVNPNDLVPDEPDDQSNSGGSAPVDPANLVPDTEDQPVNPNNLVPESPYGSPGQQALTAVEGAAEGVIGPLAPLAEAGLAKYAPQMAQSLSLTPEDMAAREAENPITHGVSQVAGTIGSLAAGPLSLVGKAADAAKISAIGASALKGFITNGLIQGGDEVSKSILGQTDPNTAVSSAVANTSLMALLGGATGGIFGVGSKALSAGADAQVGTKIKSFLVGVGDALNGTSRDVANLSGQQIVKIAQETPNYLDLNPQMYANGQTFISKGISGLTQTIAKKGADIAGSAIGSNIGGLPGAIIGYNVADSIAPTLAKMVDRPVSAMSKPAIGAILRVIGTNPEGSDLASQVYNALDYANAANSGAQKINTAVEGLFSKGAQQVYNSADTEKRSALKQYINQGGINQSLQQTMQQMPYAQKYAEGGLVAPAPEKPKDMGSIFKGSVSQSLPEHDLMINSVRANASNYLTNLQPAKYSPKLAFDEQPMQTEQNRSYDKALDVANSPLSVLDKISDGTIEPEHIKHLNGMYPELSQHLQQKITERITKAQLDNEKPDYHVRTGLSMFMGTALDGTLVPQNIQAAQAVFTPTQPAAAPQGGGGRNKKNTSTLSKVSSQYLTQTQASTAGQQKPE